MKQIPNELLLRAEREARPPVKKSNLRTGEIFAAVAHLKAAERLQKSPEPAWKALRNILDDAAERGDYTAFDDLQKALSKLEVNTVEITISGEDGGNIVLGKQTNPPRAPVTVGIIQAIKNLQFATSRAPTRKEIIDEFSRMDPDGIDETELSRQLTRLGWNDLI